MSVRRAAIVTGGSSGIGLALARMLGEEGHGVTITGRRPEKLAAAADALRRLDVAVNPVAANFAGPGCEDEVRKVVASHREHFGRLDVLCNNAGASMRETAGDVVTRRMEVQIDVNLRQVIFFYRECLPMLRAAAAEHDSVNVVNTASSVAKAGVGGMGIYSATKHALLGYTQAMNQELAGQGIKSCVLCPGFVDTPMSDPVKHRVAAESMIRPDDIATMVRALLKLSRACLVPEIVILRRGG